MPWDTNLNSDVKNSVQMHIDLTRKLDDDDERKFLLSTPKRGVKSFLRVLEGCPSSRRIVQDTIKVLSSLDAIIDAKGTVVQGLGDRSGKRKSLAETKQSGGVRKKRVTHGSAFGGKWVHPDVRDLYSPETVVEVSEPIDNSEESDTDEEPIDNSEESDTDEENVA